MHIYNICAVAHRADAYELSFFSDQVHQWANGATLLPAGVEKAEQEVMFALSNLQNPGRSLHYLDLSDCGLQTLPPESIWERLNGLDGLYLVGNELPGRELEKLASMTSPHHLDLSHNPLQYIPECVLKGMDNLRYLEAKGCQLQELPKSLLASHRLGTLDLRGNPQLSSLPEELGYSLPDLSVLDIRETVITSLPQSLQLLEYLKVQR